MTGYTHHMKIIIHGAAGFRLSGSAPDRSATCLPPVGGAAGWAGGCRAAGDCGGTGEGARRVRPMPPGWL